MPSRYALHHSSSSSGGDGEGDGDGGGSGNRRRSGYKTAQGCKLEELKTISLQPAEQGMLHMLAGKGSNSTQLSA